MTKEHMGIDAEFDAFLKGDSKLAQELQQLGAGPSDALTDIIMQRAEQQLKAEAASNALTGVQGNMAANDPVNPGAKVAQRPHFLRDWPSLFALAASLVLTVLVGIRWQAGDFDHDVAQVAQVSPIKTTAGPPINVVALETASSPANVAEASAVFAAKRSAKHNKAESDEMILALADKKKHQEDLAARSSALPDAARIAATATASRKLALAHSQSTLSKENGELNSVDVPGSVTSIADKSDHVKIDETERVARYLSKPIDDDKNTDRSAIVAHTNAMPIAVMGASQPAPPLAAPVSMAPLHPLRDPENILAQRTIYLDADSIRLRGTANKEMIKAHAKYLIDHPQSKLRLVGHTEQRYGKEYAFALGQKMADEICKQLLLLGVPKSQVEPVSMGREKPKVEGNSARANTQNRRVEFVYP